MVLGCILFSAQALCRLHGLQDTCHGVPVGLLDQGYGILGVLFRAFIPGFPVRKITKIDINFRGFLIYYTQWKGNAHPRAPGAVGKGCDSKMRLNISTVPSASGEIYQVSSGEAGLEGEPQSEGGNKTVRFKIAVKNGTGIKSGGDSNLQEIIDMRKKSEIPAKVLYAGQNKVRTEIQGKSVFFYRSKGRTGYQRKGGWNGSIVVGRVVPYTDILGCQSPAKIVESSVAGGKMDKTDIQGGTPVKGIAGTQVYIESGSDIEIFIDILGKTQIEGTHGSEINAFIFTADKVSRPAEYSQLAGNRVPQVDGMAGYAFVIFSIIDGNVPDIEGHPLNGGCRRGVPRCCGGSFRGNQGGACPQGPWGEHAEIALFSGRRIKITIQRTKSGNCRHYHYKQIKFVPAHVSLRYCWTCVNLAFLFQNINLLGVEFLQVLHFVD